MARAPHPTRTRERILKRLYRQERIRGVLKWVYPVVALAKFAACYYIYRVHLHDFYFSQDESLVETTDLALSHARHFGLISIFMSGIAFFVMAVKAWIGSSERFAVIELLESDSGSLDANSVDCFSDRVAHKESARVG